MITGNVNTAGAQAIMRRAQAALAPGVVDQIVDRIALQTLASVVRATPKKWFGQVRRSWQIKKPHLGFRIVQNENPIMRFLEHGTANKGTGYIYPKRAKALFIPLTRKAATAPKSGGKRAFLTVRSGVSKSKTLVYGVDYVLAKRVRGIKPRYIVRDERIRTSRRLHIEMQDHIRRKVINNGK